MAATDNSAANRCTIALAASTVAVEDDCYSNEVFDVTKRKKQGHPLAAERAKRTHLLQQRDRPDYCYSDEENEAVEMPDYLGPFAEDTPHADVTHSREYVVKPLDDLEEWVDKYNGGHWLSISD